MEYVPDNDEDTQDTEEDAILERTTVCEHPNKGLILLASLGYDREFALCQAIECSE